MATSKVKRLYGEPPVKNENFNKTMNKLVKHKNIFLIFILWLNISVIRGQQAPPFGYTRDPRWYSREGVDYKPPDPGDPNYRTYEFNNRRYGYYQPNGYGTQYPGQSQPGQYNPNNPLGDDRFKFDPNNPSIAQTPFPGILGGWREDLQGRIRQDSQFLERDIFVTTNYGQVQGFKVYLYDDPNPKSFYRPWHNQVEKVTKEVSVFLGIPYALPPTFEGRFKPPRPHRGWQLLQAVDFGPACPQPVIHVGATKGIRDMDEDCLYLNIYTPTTKAGVPQKYPVMVYIHGGHFTKGASNVFPGHIMAAFYDVVIVTFNYRLGALGFLSTSDENSPGNYGILDQSMAVRWVYDNIEYFNGDRNSITLFGPDAGAASAGLLMVAPQTRNIVTKVIAQSGSATADWALTVDMYRAQNTSRVFGQQVGCAIETSWKLLQCLRRSRNAFEIGNAEFPPQVGFFPWAPVMEFNITYPAEDWYEGWREPDWHFIKETPERLVRKRMFNKGLHYMTGVTMQEAAYFVAQNESLAPYFEIDEKFFDQKVRELVLRYNYTLNLNGTYDAIKYMYTHWPDPKNKTHIREQYINLLSDFIYRAPADQMLKLLVEQKVPCYAYVLNTTIEAFNWPEWRKYTHDNEYFFLSGAPFMDVEFFPKKLRLERTMWTDNDRNMSHFFMKTFSDFARYGNPTPQQVLGLYFEKAGNGELKYLNLNTTFNSSVQMNYRQTESAFWTMYIPAVVGMMVPTYPPSTEFWWEPREPLQIAFWSMTGLCLFLMAVVVIACILWRNAKLEANRFYDNDIFMLDNPEAEQISVVNNVVQSQPIKSQSNIYDYRETPSSKMMAKSPLDSSSIRSPSSIGNHTQTASKFGSQGSIRSAISGKESSISPVSKETTLDKRSLERGIDTESTRSANRYEDTRSLLKRERSKESILTGTSERKGATTPAPRLNEAGGPVPASRRAVSKTHLIDGIPQTEV